MSLSSISLKRLVLVAMVMSIIIVLFAGWIRFNFLGVRGISFHWSACDYNTDLLCGANAEVIESQITEPLEKQSTVLQDSIDFFQ